ncbi:MAG: histidine phosphatase family protein [Actinomycetota bacterium]|nr:histidine phosphatase family protein [Actinomycetota bacterium]
MELIFVRHGRPEHVVTEDGSPADPPLSDIGHVQASAMADWLAEEHIDAVYSSPMQRARETARPLERALGLSAVIREGISEFDRHSTAYIPTEVLRATDREAWLKMASGDFMDDMGDPAAWMEMVIETVETIVDDHTGQRVAVVCHGGVVNAYLAHCLDFLPEQFMRFDVDYTSVSRVMASTRGHRSVTAVNERTHFRGRPELAVRD